MTRPLVTIQCVIFNGERYIRHCLEAVKKQTYPHTEIIIFDNASTDSTADIAEKEFSAFQLIRHTKNLGMWPGHEEALRYAHGQIIICLSVDVILEPDFVERCVEGFLKNSRAGAIQAKVYQYSLADPNAGFPLPRKTIDTCGFIMKRSRRLLNLGHGEEDVGQFERPCEIFGVEGAVPAFRKAALEDIRIEGRFADVDFFWYADDIDMAWRMAILGWEQIYLPSAIAHHDRQTTKSHRASILDFIKIRRSIPSFKRRLDYRNYIFTLIKNDYLINVFHDILPIAIRQAGLWAYFLIFEPFMLLEIPRIIRKIPAMLRRRHIIMSRAKTGPEAIRSRILS